MPFGLSIDIDAVKCVDLGHHWRETFYGRVPHGKLKGLPVRAAVCETCGSAKVEYLSWDGKVKGRSYDPDDAYIANARALSDDFHSRRSALREAKNNRLKKQGERGNSPWDRDV